MLGDPRTAVCPRFASGLAHAGATRVLRGVARDWKNLEAIWPPAKKPRMHGEYQHAVTPSLPKRPRMTYQFPTDEVMAPGWVEWADVKGGFYFVVDNQIVCDVANGRAENLNTTCLADFESHTEHVVRMVGKGWLPGQPWQDPVRWVPREPNTWSDAIATETLRRRCSWHAWHPMSRCYLHDTHAVAILRSLSLEKISLAVDPPLPKHRQN